MVLKIEGSKSKDFNYINSCNEWRSSILNSNIFGIHKKNENFKKFRKFQKFPKN